jgi:hypothetical protein
MLSKSLQAGGKAGVVGGRAPGVRVVGMSEYESIGESACEKLVLTP